MKVASTAPVIVPTSRLSTTRSTGFNTYAWPSHTGTIGRLARGPQHRLAEVEVDSEIGRRPGADREAADHLQAALVAARNLKLAVRAVDRDIGVARHVRIRLHLEAHPGVLAGRHFLAVEQHGALLTLKREQVDRLRRNKIARDRGAILWLELDPRELHHYGLGVVDR